MTDRLYKHLAGIPDNIELLEEVDFGGNIDRALDWIKANLGRFRSDDAQRKPTAKAVGELLAAKGKTHGISDIGLRIRTDAYDAYRENRQVIDSADFGGKMDAAIAWVKQNKDALQSRMPGGELTHGYITGMLFEAGKLEGISYTRMSFSANAYDLYQHNRALVDGADFGEDIEKYKAWMKANFSLIKERGRVGEKSVSYVNEMLKEAGKLRGLNDTQVRRWGFAFQLCLLNSELIDSIDFHGDVAAAAEWSVRNARALTAPRTESVRRREAVEMLIFAGKLDGMDAEPLLEMTKRDELYALNKTVFDHVDFNRSIDSAIEWVKGSARSVRLADDEAPSISLVAKTLEERGKLDGIDKTNFMYRLSAYGLYLRNIDLVRPLKLKDADAAIEWAKANRDNLTPEDAGKPTGLVHIVSMLKEAGKIGKNDGRTVHMRAGAYDLYLKNKELVDGCDFGGSDETAITWIKENRDRVAPQEIGGRLGLGYIAMMFAEADAKKYRGLIYPQVTRRLNAYEMYLQNKQLIDPVEFDGDWKKALEWMKGNRDSVISSEPDTTISLSYLAVCLSEAGKLDGIVLNDLRKVSGAYDYFLARKPDFMIAAAGHPGTLTQATTARELRLAARKMLKDPKSRLFMRLDKQEKIAESYLYTIINVASDDIDVILQNPKKDITPREVKLMGEAYSKTYGRIKNPRPDELEKINQRIEEMQRAIEAGLGATNPKLLQRLKK